MHSPQAIKQGEHELEPNMTMKQLPDLIIFCLMPLFAGAVVGGFFLLIGAPMWVCYVAAMYAGYKISN